jgi:hypothetical protein
MAAQRTRPWHLLAGGEGHVHGLDADAAWAAEAIPDDLAGAGKHAG